MSALTLESFASQLGMLLRDQPRGMAADLTDFAIAYWNGKRLVYSFLRDDGSGRIDEEFDLANYVWVEWASACAAWSAMPTFTARPEVLEWLKDAPPHAVLV